MNYRERHVVVTGGTVCLVKSPKGIA
jgi:hypothetical protein